CPALQAGKTAEAQRIVGEAWKLLSEKHEEARQAFRPATHVLINSRALSRGPSVSPHQVWAITAAPPLVVTRLPSLNTTSAVTRPWGRQLGGRRGTSGSRHGPTAR